MTAFTLTIDNNNFNVEWGQVYLVSAPRAEIEDFFNYKSKTITLINMPQKKAIKIPLYFKWRWLKRNKILNEVNQLALFPQKLNHHSYFELLILILYSEMRKKEILVIEIAGMDNTSILNLLKFSNVLLKKFEKRIIIFTDPNYLLSKVGTQFIQVNDPIMGMNNLKELLP